jgi:putative chitinase
MSSFWSRLFGRRPAPPPVPVVTAAQLKAIFPSMLEPDGQVTSPRAARFLAIVGHETGAFRRLSESLDYDMKRLREVFGPHRITDEQAAPLVRTPTRPANQVAIANIVYGAGNKVGRELGNLSPGDGWAWRGGGWIQLTGLENYTRTAGKIGKTATELVALVRSHEGAALASALWWQAAGCNALADRADCVPGGDGFAALVRRCNGGEIGLAERTEILRRADRVLGVVL